MNAGPVLTVDAQRSESGPESATGLDLLDFVGTLMTVFKQLSVTVILPIAVGQLVRPSLSGWLERTKPPLSSISQVRAHRSTCM